MPLVVTESKRAVAAMDPASVKTSIATLKDLATKDEAKRAQEAAKSNLEAYIYSIRERVEEDEELRMVTNETQRERFAQELSEAEDWLYMDGAESTAAAFDAKKSGLQSTGDEWLSRARNSPSAPPPSRRQGISWRKPRKQLHCSRKASLGSRTRRSKGCFASLPVSRTGWTKRRRRRRKRR